MKKQEIITAVAEKENKYYDLVWYARKTENQYNTISEVKENVDRIEKIYPAETNELNSMDSDWAHGFNSGILAGMRYVLSLYDMGKEQAEADFPFLDT